MDIYGFQQKINKPTRVDKNTGKKSLLDHIWTNSNNLISWGVKQGVSDHFGTFIVTMLVDSRTHGMKTYKKSLKNLTNLINALKTSLKGDYILKKLDRLEKILKKFGP